MRLPVAIVAAVVVLVALPVALLVFVVGMYRIPSSAMEPTLRCPRQAPGCTGDAADRILVNKAAYWFGDPERGDVVVYETPARVAATCGAGGTFVHRIVALPGEMFEVKGGSVFIDGRRLEEPYVPRNRRDTSPVPPRRLDSSEYYVLGDNRIQSCDSRAWGGVPRGNLIGPVFARYWPADRAGGV